MKALDLLGFLAALPVVAASTYLLALTLFSRRAPTPAYATPHLKFEVVVPAHDEERGISQTVASLLALAYPAELRRVTVVADNCADGTAEKALASGARVLPRQDAERRGKGYALAFAFERILAEGWADAVVVVDADSVASANLLGAFAARIDAGARAVQGHYGVANPNEGWRTRLMAVAFALFHEVRSAARERLSLSCGLRGNGMCFTVPLLREVPHDAFSIVEDLEYGIRLGEAGVRVHYAGEAEVLGEMVASESASRSQRRRWEGGRWALARRHLPSLLTRGLARGDRVRLDLAADLLTPPLSGLLLAAAAGDVLTAVLWVQRGVWPVCGPLFGWATLALGIYAARGWQLSGVGARGILDAVYIPVYVIWKLSLAFRRGKASKDDWVRTARQGEGR